jgi:hypothetical protein
MIADAAQASALAQLARSPGSPALPSALSQLGCPSSSYSRSQPPLLIRPAV